MLDNRTTLCMSTRTNPKMNPEKHYHHRKNTKSIRPWPHSPNASKAHSIVRNLIFNQTIQQHYQYLYNTWGTTRILSILKTQMNTSYRRIALLSPFVKILESIIHTKIKSHLPQCIHQHGFRIDQSIITGLHSIVSDGNKRSRCFLNISLYVFSLNPVLMNPGGYLFN